MSMVNVLVQRFRGLTLTDLQTPGLYDTLSKSIPNNNIPDRN